MHKKETPNEDKIIENQINKLEGDSTKKNKELRIDDQNLNGSFIKDRTQSLMKDTSTNNVLDQQVDPDKNKKVNFKNCKDKMNMDVLVGENKNDSETKSCIPATLVDRQMENQKREKEKKRK